jgi:hypothetical protein
MPQMSSTDRILMAAQDITDALKHSHSYVPFDTIGDDKITALTTLLEIFTRKLKTGGNQHTTVTAKNCV